MWLKCAKAEVTTEDAVKGDRESNGLIENAVMLIRGIIQTIKCHIESRTQDESLILPCLVEHAGCILSRCRKGRDGKTPHERLHGKKRSQEFVPFVEKALERQEQNEYQMEVGSGVVSSQRQGLQDVERSAADAEPEAPVEVQMLIGADKRGALPSALAANTRRIIADRKSNEDRKRRSSRIGQHHRVVNHGSCAQMGKTIKLL